MVEQSKTEVLVMMKIEAVTKFASNNTKKKSIIFAEYGVNKKLMIKSK